MWPNFPVTNDVLGCDTLKLCDSIFNKILCQIADICKISIDTNVSVGVIIVIDISSV